MARFIRSCVFFTFACAFTALAPATAARVARLPKPPATTYSYAGNVYDRFFSVASQPRFLRTAPRLVRDARLRTLAAAPYGIVDLAQVVANALGGGPPSNGFGIPTGVDDAGHIPYYDLCECAGSNNNITLVVNDTGTFSEILFEDESVEGAGDAVPYGVSPNGNIVGQAFMDYGGDTFDQVIAWTNTGGYYSGDRDTTAGLAINDAGVSVGFDIGVKGAFAAEFSINARGAVNRALLAPPKNTSWTGVATGINDGGEIVGYATFPGGSGDGRAVRFALTGNAQVLPVGMPGVSTDAQAINQHGDVVGSAGSEAFLYRNNRVTYLPRPPGDEAGNAVAYAINASDEVVGTIGTSSRSTGAFLYLGGSSYDLNALLPANSGWQIISAVGINDAGQIVGSGYFAGDGGALTAYSLKPTTQASRLQR